MTNVLGRARPGAAPFLERPIMRDPEAERELSDQGFTVIDLLAPDEVAVLHDFYASHAALGDLNREGAHNDYYAEFTIMTSRSDFRELAYQQIVRTAVPRVHDHLHDVRPVVANFVSKTPGGGLVPVHQNMSVVDEQRARSVSVWIALVDCGLDNGTLELAPGSHRAFRGRRGTWAYSQFTDIDDATIAANFTPVCVRAGQAIVLDDAVIHHSRTNTSERRRLAIQLVMSPRELDAVYFECVAESNDQLELDVLAVEPEYFFDFWGGAGDRSKATVLDRVSVKRTRHGPEVFDELGHRAPDGSLSTRLRRLRRRTIRR